MIRVIASSRVRLTLSVSLMLVGCAGHRAGHRAGPPVSSPAVASPAVASSAVVSSAVVSPDTPDCPLCLDPGSPEILAAYVAAIEAARYPSPEAFSRQLTPLLPSTEGLIWNDRGQVLMVTWTRSRYYSDPETHRRGKPFSLAVDAWLMPAPFVRDVCRALGLEEPMLTLRLEQLIGLPPGRGKDAFLEIWVDPTDLFRPCPDPEISDHECLVEVPVVGGDVAGNVAGNTPSGPWDCTLKRQVSGRFVTVHPGHLEWMCANWNVSYGNDETFDNYPWTALGYTYDWGNPDDPVGFSEYVALHGSPVVFQSLTPTELYCSNLGESD